MFQVNTRSYASNILTTIKSNWTAFHQQLKLFSDDCHLPIACLLFKQTVQCSECPPAPATHDQSLLRNAPVGGDYIRISP